MKKMLFGLLLALTYPCFATQYAAQHGNDVIVLDDQVACPEATGKVVLQRGAPAELVAGLRRFSATIDGKELHGCWLPVEGSVALIWDDGDIGQISQSLFHVLKEV